MNMDIQLLVLVLYILIAPVMYFLYKKRLQIISKLKNELHIQKNKLEAILSNMEDGLLITDAGGIITYANPMVERVLENDINKVTGEHIDRILHLIKERVYKNHNSLLHSGTSKDGECCCHSEYTPENGIQNHSCFKAKFSSLIDEKGKAVGNIVIIPGMIECDEAHQLIHRMAHYDPLTDLANRVLIKETLEEMLSKAKDTKSKVAVAFVDLDNFKLINDTMGHDAGDMVLKEASKIIQNNLDPGDFAGRFGGDEFVILMPNADRTEVVIKKVKRLIDSLNKPIHIKDSEFYIPASVGISIYPRDGASAEGLIKNADVAMYSAKGLGKNTFRIYNQEMNEESTEKLKMINDMKNAIKNNEFKLYYQPQIDVSTKEVVGMEALVRWEHPEKGLVPPMDFIPLAEETGLIIAIGEWVLREACRQNKYWQTLGYKPLRMAVNLSIVQFEHRNLVGTVKKILSDTGLDPEWLELEITESLAVKCFDCAIRRINQLKKLGVYISLDDFGTGYSSYGYLNQLPIDSLKIDRIFLENLKNGSDEELITKTIISLAKRLNLTVIAEGVETASQLDFLRNQQCNLAQGFLFSRPVPAEELIGLLSGASVLN